MFDPTLPFLAISLIVMVVLLRAIGAGSPVDLSSMFPHPWELDWPRGMQEEEPQPWRLDRLGGHVEAPRPHGLPSAAAAPSDDTLDAAA